MISVIMPAYNAEEYVACAVDSILSQTFSDFEFIIVDDGSSDNTLSIIEDYAKRDGRIKVIHAEHGGPAAAVNVGISQAKYDWIAMMNADDIAMPTRFERQIKAVNKIPHAIAWGTYGFLMNERGAVVGISQTGPTTEQEFLELRRSGRLVYVIHGTTLMKRDCVLAVGGYDPQFFTGEDLELFDRLAEIGPIIAIPEPLLKIRIHNSSTTLRNFRLTRMATRYVKARQQARLKGENLPSWDAFQQNYHPASWPKRLSRGIDDRSQYFYRKFATFVSNQAYLPAVIYLLLAALLNPHFVFSKVWSQRFAKKTREMLAQRQDWKSTN